MPASGSDPQDKPRTPLRALFKEARRLASDRVVLKLKLARLSEADCREVLDYIEVMESLRAVPTRRRVSSSETLLASRLRRG
jgi:hypothetical protein